MTLRYRRRASLGPFRINMTRRGVSSIAITLGRLTYNFRHRRTTVNLPGAAYWQSQTPRKDTQS